MLDLNPCEDMNELPEPSIEDVDTLADDIYEDQENFRPNYWQGNYE